MVGECPPIAMIPRMDGALRFAVVMGEPPADEWGTQNVALMSGPPTSSVLIACQ